MNARAVFASVTICASVLATATAATAHDDHDSKGRDLELTRTQERVIEQATRRFRNPEAAVASGYLPSDECVELPGVGGMGYHYVKPQLIDGEVDPRQPEVLVYYRSKPGGKLRLGALEYLVPDADQDTATDADRPALYGHRFDGPMPGHEQGMPVHYDLHVWLYKRNPAGTLAAWNPDVHC